MRSQTVEERGSGNRQTLSAALYHVTHCTRIERLTNNDYLHNLISLNNNSLQYPKICYYTLNNTFYNNNYYHEVKS